MVFLGDYKEILANPDSFFQREHSIGYALGFGFLMLLVQSFLNVFSRFLTGISTEYISPLGSLIGAMIGETLNFGSLMFGLVIVTGLIHVFVALLGDSDGFGETFSVIAFATAVLPLMSLVSLFVAAFSFIPVVGAIIGFIGLLPLLAIAVYGLYIAVSGLSQVHGMTKGQAAGAIVLTIVSLAVIAVIISFVMLALGAALIGAVAAA